MRQDIKELREHLARAKAYLSRMEPGTERAELLRSLLSLASALQLLLSPRIFGRDKMEAENLVRELLQLYDRLEVYKTYCPKGLTYTKSKGKELLVALLGMAKQIKGDEDSESVDDTRNRKLQIDKHLIRGTRLLALHKVKDAEREFKAAAELYVDEHILFKVIADKFVAAKVYRPATPYIEQALKAMPDEEAVYLLASEVRENTGEIQRAMDLLTKAKELFGETGEIMARYAQLYLRLKQFPEALHAAIKALALNPDLRDMKKIIVTLKKRGVK